MRVNGFYAILKGLLNNDSVKINQLSINDIEEEKVNLFVQEFKAVKAEPKSLIAESEAVLLAVKPYQIESVIRDNLTVFKEGQPIISIAGIKTSTIEAMLENKGYSQSYAQYPALVGQEYHA